VSRVLWVSTKQHALMTRTRSGRCHLLISAILLADRTTISMIGQLGSVVVRASDL